MATGKTDDTSSIYQTPEAPGDAEKLRQDGIASPDRHGASAPPADGNFLGNVHRGTSVDPDAYVRPAADRGDHSEAAGEGSDLVVSADGVPVDIPQVPTFGGVSITVEISGVPESVVLSSGRSQASGTWRLDRADLDEVFLLPANGAAEATLDGPLSLNVAMIVVDTETGAESRTSTVVEVDPVPLGPVGPVVDTDSAPDSVVEGAAGGQRVGLTAWAGDPDAGDSVAYSLLDDADGRFVIDPVTGEVRVADGVTLDHEAADSHTVTVQAVSSDGSKQTRDFTIAVGDENEFSIAGLSDSDATFDFVSESAASGDSVGLTAFAEDGDGSDSVTYSLLLDADGRFRIDATTGEVTVADAALLDHETHQSHAIVVKAQSSDGSATARFFFISVGDDTSEFSVGAIADIDTAADGISESAASGDSVGIRAFAEDGDRSDSVTYSLTNSADGRFKIDATTGEITVDNAALLDHETDRSHTITVRAESSDGSFRTHDFTIAVGNENEFSITAISDGDARADTVSEFASNDDSAGITAVASDFDLGDTVTYSLTDDAEGRFKIDATTGDVTVADASLLDQEVGDSHKITVRAESSDGSFQTRDFTIAVGDENEAPTALSLTNGDTYGNAVAGHTPVAHWRLDDYSGSAVAADATGNHDGTYEQGANHGNGPGPFARIGHSAAGFDGSNDYVEVSNSSDFDLPEGTIQAWFKVDDFDGKDHTIFSMGSSGTDTGSVYLAVDGNRGDVEFFIEDASTGRGLGSTSNHHLLSGNNSVQKGHWHHVAVTFGPGGIVMYLDGAEVDSNPYTGGIGNADDEPITIGASQRNASTEGQALPGQLDRFFDGQIAEVALYGSALSAVELAALADSGINGYDIPGDTVAEGAQNGTVVGVVETRDPDSGESFTYSLLDDAGGRFAIDGATGEVSVLDGSKLDYETARQHTVTVQVTDSGGLSYSDSFVINLVDMPAMFGPGTMVGTDASEIMIGTGLSEGGGGEDIILGMGGDDRLEGHGNEDRLVGGEGDDSLSGGAGDDILVGGAGNDVSDGGSGNDAFVFRMGDGNDTVSGGTGTDAIVLMGGDGGVPALSDWTLHLTTGSATWLTDRVTLSSDATGTITFTDGSSIAFDSIERIDFSGDYAVDGGRSAIDIAASGGETIAAGSAEDTLIGGVGADILSGGSNEDLLLGNEGADDLSGGSHDDVLYGGSGADTMAGNAGDDILVGGTGNDTLYGGEQVSGKAADAGGDDMLYGNAGDDSLSGGIGTDFLDGGSGADILDGGDGVDTAFYGNSTAGVTVDLGARTGAGGDAEGDTLVRVENVTGSDFNDVLTGDSEDNTLAGGAGDDILHGGTATGGKGGTIGGNDTLLGEAGNDQLDGGDGDDTLSGGEGNDILTGGLGDDTAFGGAGDDTYVFGDGGGSDSFDGGGGSWTDTVRLSGRDGLDAYNGWTVTGVTVTSSGNDFIELADDSDGTITLDDGSELTFTDVDRIEW